MAASAGVVIIVNSPPSTAITYTPAAPSFNAPVPAGTVMGNVAVQPPEWKGAFVLSGPDQGSFALSTDGVLTAAVPLAVNTDGYKLIITAAP